jgi:hypothetical protein
MKFPWRWRPPIYQPHCKGFAETKALASISGYGLNDFWLAIPLLVFFCSLQSTCNICLDGSQIHLVLPHHSLASPPPLRLELLSLHSSSCDLRFSSSFQPLLN